MKDNNKYTVVKQSKARYEVPNGLSISLRLHQAFEPQKVNSAFIDTQCILDVQVGRLLTFPSTENEKAFLSMLPRKLKTG